MVLIFTTLITTNFTMTVHKMAMSIFHLAFVGLIGLPPAFGAKILISSMYGEGSHFLAGASVGEALVQRGHNVTCLIGRAYGHRATDPKFANLSFETFDHRDMSVEDVHKLFYELNTLAFRSNENQLMEIMLMLVQTMADDCEALLLNSDLMKRLEEFDAIVSDVSWPCGTGIKAFLEEKGNQTKKIASISILPLTPSGLQLYLLGSPYNPAYQPEVSSGFSNKMTFSQRTANLFFTAVTFMIGRFLSVPAYNRVAKNVGLEHYTLDVWKWHEEFDLHLASFDFASEFPFPLAPNIIPVGGLTARLVTQLDDDLEAFMQNAGDHGVIVFTLGTYLASVTKIRPGFAEMFAEAFRRLPQKVIWQLKELPDWELPPNVKTMPWVPQNDLLGHPQTRVFLYQGGNNGFQEACYHGTPTVVVPLHVDQYDVAARTEARGIGRKMDKLQLSADLIYDTLSDVLSDPKYTIAAEEVSAIMKSNPVTARDRAAFWVEHVIKYGGDHLKSPAAELSFIQFYMLDALALILLVILLIVVIIVLVLRRSILFLYRSFSKVKQKQL